MQVEKLSVEVRNTYHIRFSVFGFTSTNSQHPNRARGVNNGKYLTWQCVFSAHVVSIFEYFTYLRLCYCRISVCVRKAPHRTQWAFAQHFQHSFERIRPQAKHESTHTHTHTLTQYTEQSQSHWQCVFETVQVDVNVRKRMYRGHTSLVALVSVVSLLMHFIWAKVLTQKEFLFAVSTN